jgi:hypothetical protein
MLLIRVIVFSDNAVSCENFQPVFLIIAAFWRKKAVNHWKVEETDDDQYS